MTKKTISKKLAPVKEVQDEKNNNIHNTRRKIEEILLAQEQSKLFEL